MKRIHPTISITIIMMLIACSSNTGNKQAAEPFSTANKVVTRMIADPDNLDYFKHTNMDATNIIYFLQKNLLEIDFRTLKITPVLAKEMPVLEEMENGKLHIHYEIRPEATWDDGTPITAKDLEFSLKVLKNPKVDAHHTRMYFEFIEDIILYDDPKKLTWVFKEPYMSAELVSGDFPPLDKRVYDPEGLMDEFTLNELTNNAGELSGNEKILRFAENYNGEKFGREIAIGNGPYAFEKWETNQRVVLKKKENWWGDKVTGVETMLFDAFPESLIFETVNDEKTAVVALKGEKLDIMHMIPAKDFVDDLQKSESFKSRFELFTPPYLAYDYVVMNQKAFPFEDIAVRKAFNHLVNVDRIIETAMYGLGERINAFLHPSNPFYNHDLTPYDFDLEKAKALLVDAGWKDSNGNGQLDKMNNGKLQEFEINLKFNSGNQRRKSACMIIQEAARKVGIKVNVLNRESSVLHDELKSHDFDAAMFGWVAPVVESDPKQIWHSSSYNGGSNYGGFGSPESDALIDALRREMDREKRKEYYLRLQKMVVDDAPYVFMAIQSNRLAISKRLTNRYASTVRPGFWSASYKVMGAID